MAAATAAAAAASRFFGTRIYDPKPRSGKFQARFGFGTKKSPPSPPPKKTFSDSNDRLVWFPGATPPEWLDGTMIGDRGFDPFGFAKPAEYLQFDFDSLDQNLAKNVAGEIIGVRTEATEINPTPFQRTRRCSGCRGSENDAGKVELVEGSSYLGQPLPFSLTTLIWIEVLVIGYIEFQRNAELDPEKRLYPGGYFDPLGLASDPEKKENLQLAEIKHARLAMVAFLIFGIQAAVTGKGPISFVATFKQ
ncbi:Chlorophyll a-b binding protein, chloroplastic [Melia azedarach]|uniref:Chlorophyll a-b binding protein, chloroplastic n=1 Tax=Melia azedarach TaxID=155640 RepID=A0ACC1Y9C4_MELAZ|nr:Chlorophyll a-b binding protein, chloroplastic [Melia azedarach]